MSSVLREEQVKGIDEIKQVVDRGLRPLYNGPTGMGKMVMIANMSARMVGSGNHPLLLFHRRELLFQAQKAFREFHPEIRVGFIAAGMSPMPWADVFLGMVGTVKNRISHLLRPAALVIDEAHHVRAATWKFIIDYWPGIPVVGFTATPERLDQKGLGKDFDVIVQGPTVQELIDIGRLPPVRVLRIPINMKVDAEGNFDHAVSAAAVAAYHRYTPGQRAIFFGVNRTHSKRVAAELQAQGYRAAHVDGDDHYEKRARILNEFGTGGLDVVCNCDIISEGFDVPACDVVILGAPTQSVSRYLQCTGRGMRIRPGKIETTVLDLTGNSYRLGLVQDDRKWSLADGEVTQPDAMLRPSLKTCEICRTVFRGSKCPGCNWEPVLDTPEEVDTHLNEAKSRKTVKDQDMIYAALRKCKSEPHPRQAVLKMAETWGFDSDWAETVSNLMGM